MQIDLHVHTTCSDGELCIPFDTLTFFSGYSLVAFTDHEHIFNPVNIQTNDSVKFISGVEICCNHKGKNIEILGYDFDANNADLVKLVYTVKELRINAICKILNENGISPINLPPNPFRINVPLPGNLDTRKFWQSHSLEYKTMCHSVSAVDVINTIVAAHGIPVFAHPMESLASQNENDVEMFIRSLGIRTIELITPKHDQEDVALIRNIIVRNNLFGSIGSDSHKQTLTKIPHEYDINENYFEWIRKIVAR